jgi:hypothetical protein
VVRPREQDVISTIETLIKRHPLLTYYTRTVAFSWGGILLVVGPGGILSTPEQFKTLPCILSCGRRGRRVPKCFSQ